MEYDSISPLVATEEEEPTVEVCTDEPMEFSWTSLIGDRAGFADFGFPRRRDTG